MNIFYRLIAWIFRNRRYKDKDELARINKERSKFWPERTEDDIELPAWFIVVVFALFALDLIYEADHSLTVPALWSWLMASLQ